jgi:hypothetical protein
MADGYITIETKLSTNKFDKQVTDLEKKIKNEEEKAQLKLKAKLQAEDELQRHKQAVLEIEKQYEKTSQQVERLQNIMDKQGKGISLTPQDFTDLQNYAEINKQNEKLGATLDKAYEKQTKLNNKVEQTSLAYKQIQDNVQGYKTKIEGVKLQKQQSQVNSIKKNFDSVSKSVGKAIGRVARLALGVVSIASAYRLVTSASTTLAKYDKQYASNIEFIKYLLAQALAPALKFLVNLASTLLSYLNYILNAWFKITLFSKDSVKNFVKGQKSLKSSSKSTKKIKSDLQTTKFDEMEVLKDKNKTTEPDITTPTIDPSKLAGEVPDWLQFIVDHKDEILAVIAGIAGGLLAWQLGFDGLKSLGIGVMIGGILYAIEGIIEYMKDPSFKNFGKVIEGIGIAIIGLGILIGSVPVAVSGAVVLILGIILKYWEQIKGFFQKGIDWLRGKSDDIHKKFGDTIGTIYDMFVNNLQSVLNIFDSFFKMIKGIFDGIITFVKGVFTGNWKQAWEGIKKIFENIFIGTLNIFANIIGLMKGKVINIGQTTGEILSNIFKKVVDVTLRTIEKVLNSPIRAINKLIGAINSVPGINIPVLSTFNLPRLKAGGIINMPRKRSTSRRWFSSRRRSRKRRCYSTYRQSSNGNIRRSNR